VTLQDGCCVLDVGANTGLFTLFVCNRYPDARVFAFEPAPPIFEKLRANLAQYPTRAVALPQGLSDSQRSASIRYYPRMSANSGLYADAASESELTAQFLRNASKEGEELAAQLLQGAFEAQTFSCELTTVSQVLAQHGLESVDLLKIDVEKSEWDVLQGIEPGDWPKIHQLVIEIHDLDGRAARIRNMLEAQGYHCVLAQERSLRDTSLYQLYASRTGLRAEATAQAHPADTNPRLAPVCSDTIYMSELRSALGARLPQAMVPAAYVLLPQFPLTANGKLDRRSLPAPAATGQRRRHVAPRTELERRLAQIWAEVLQLERIGVEDNFFEIGGDSILSLRVVNRALKLGVVVTTRQIFEHQTIAALAPHCSQVADAFDSDRQAVVHGAQPLTPAQRRLLSRAANSERLPIECMAFALPPALQVDAAFLEALTQALYRRHDSLRLCLDQDGARPGESPRLRYRSCDEPLVRSSFAIEELASMTDATDAAAIRERAQSHQQALDQVNGPLLKIVLLQAARPGATRLLLLTHSLACDSASRHILVKDVIRAFAQWGENGRISLDPKTSSYQSWAERLHAWSETDAANGVRQLWLQQRPIEIEWLSLFAAEQGAAPTIDVALERADSEALLQRCRKEGFDIQEALLASLAVALYRWMRISLVRIDVETDGRRCCADNADFSETVGAFTLRYPLTLDLQSASLEQALAAVASVWRAMGSNAHTYDMLTCATGDAELTAHMQQVRTEIAFGYAPDRFIDADELAGAGCVTCSSAPYALRIDVGVFAGQLRILLGSDPQRVHPHSARRLASCYLDELRSAARGRLECGSEIGSEWGAVADEACLPCGVEPVVRFGARRQRPCLVLLPPGAAGVEAYFYYVRQLPEDQPVALLENIELYSRVLRPRHALVDYYCRLLEAESIQTGFIGGYSRGAMLAPHVAGQLRARGRPVKGLLLFEPVVVDVREPALRELKDAPALAALGRREQQDVRNLTGAEEYLGALADLGVPTTIFKSNARGSAAGIERIVGLYKGAVRKVIEEHFDLRQAYLGGERLLGAAADALPDCAVVTLPATHFDLFAARNVPELARLTRRALESTLQESTDELLR
jgi:FkbM family methyltransferase